MLRVLLMVGWGLARTSSSMESSHLRDLGGQYSHLGLGGEYANIQDLGLAPEELGWLDMAAPALGAQVRPAFTHGVESSFNSPRLT